MHKQNNLMFALGLLSLLGGMLGGALMQSPAVAGGGVLVGLGLLLGDPATRWAFVLLGRASLVTLQNLFLLLPLLLLVGGLGSVIAWQVGGLALEHLVKPGAGQQAQLLTSELTKLGVLTVWGILSAPLLDAVAIYAWRNRDGKRSFGGAVNYALNRFGRMFGPHALSFTGISLGMSVIIPGIMFGLWWAWVDAITATRDRTLDPLLRSLGRDPDSRSPLQWSRVLSRGHRLMIVRTWLPYSIWYVPAAMYLVYQAEGAGWHWVLVFGTGNMLLLTVLEMAMVGLFEDRLRLLAAQAEERGIGVEHAAESDVGAPAQ